MNDNYGDIFANMKNEDRKFGERTTKAVNTNKREKHRNQNNFSRMRVQDILAMSDDSVDAEDFEMA